MMKKKDINLLNIKRFREKGEEISINDNDSWYSCGYCKKNLEKNNYIVCSFCLRKKYCSKKCRNKDIQEHLKHCGK